ncbi:MAG: hypothetical protein M3340_04150 [Actinomycetota bacterium]|nr:hypothetical protein [Actinomycetota bacterium]
MRPFTTHLRHNVIAYVALFIALGGTSYAVSSPSSDVRKSHSGRSPAAYAYSTSFDQRLEDGVFQPLRFERQRFDIGGMWDSSRPSRLVAPRTGTYVVNGVAIFEPHAGGNFAHIQRHFRGGGFQDYELESGGEQVHVTQIIRLAAGDSLELIVFERSTRTLGVRGSLSAVWVGN